MLAPEKQETVSDKDGAGITVGAGDGAGIGCVGAVGWVGVDIGAGVGAGVGGDNTHNSVPFAAVIAAK